MSPAVVSSAVARTPALPTGPAFDLVLLAHVGCVVVGLLTVVVSGAQASRLLAALAPEVDASSAPDPRSARELSLARYYAPGTNWAGRTLYGVPIFGFILLGLSHGAYGLDRGWVMSGLGLWILVAATAEGLLWPTERRIGVLLDARPKGASAPDVQADAPVGAPRRPLLAGVPVSALRRAGRTAQVLSMVLVAFLLLAIVLMVAQR